MLRYWRRAANEKSPAECGKSLAEILNHVSVLDALAPNVPPDEAAYLDKEYSDALKVSAWNRVVAVQRRTFYYPWILHARLADVRRQVSFARSALSADLKLAIQTASGIPYDVANAKIAWNEFDINSSVLTTEQIREGARRSELMIGIPGEYIWCLAGFVKN